MKRNEISGTPMEVVMAARICNGLSHYKHLDQNDIDVLEEDLKRTFRGIMLDCFMTQGVVSFPDHKDIPDLHVRVTTFDGEKLGS